MNNKTACPLDCYDACEIVYDGGKLKGYSKGHTAGFLCPHLNHYTNYQTIKTPRYKNQEITIDEAMNKLSEIISHSYNDEILHYRGHGNFSLMQEVTDHFFASYGATLTDGSLCDGAGEAGILEGRGSNKNMPLPEIEKSDVVIFWGRNPHTTSSHLLPIIKDKKIIVIDPIETQIVKDAYLHLQVKPHTDMYLAMLLSRFLHIVYPTDKEYYELTQTLMVDQTLEKIGISKNEIGEMVELIINQRVAIVCGVGIQKYSDGADVMRTIDALALQMNLFGREGCGVAYLGNSREHIDSPFYTDTKRESKVNSDFSKYKTVFIQGANPLSQMPDSTRVQESISNVENIVYFGLYENETSECADLVIPAKTFLHKNDIRTSYSHNIMSHMPKLEGNENGITEYELSSYLCNEFGIDIKEEETYLKHFKNFSVTMMDGELHVEGREELPYQNGFDTKDGKFVFLKEVNQKPNEKEGLHLITPKSAKSLNSQFNRETHVYVHSSLGFRDGEKVIVSSVNGNVELHVKNNDKLRDDCVLIYSGTRGVNNLTSPKHSLEGKSAVYQEDRVEVIKCT
ncbi:molybdopterin-dependent oxidoreductase [Sulfurimonas sp.]|nr:molybdopterin-dependent oxidoreductase [Sulfurimonas sp.]